MSSRISSKSKNITSLLSSREIGSKSHKQQLFNYQISKLSMLQNMNGKIKITDVEDKDSTCIYIENLNGQFNNLFFIDESKLFIQVYKYKNNKCKIDVKDYIQTTKKDFIDFLNHCLYVKGDDLTTLYCIVNLTKLKKYVADTLLPDIDDGIYDLSIIIPNNQITDKTKIIEYTIKDDKIIFKLYKTTNTAVGRISRDTLNTNKKEVVDYLNRCVFITFNKNTKTLEVVPNGSGGFNHSVLKKYIDTTDIPFVYISKNYIRDNNKKLYYGFKENRLFIYLLSPEDIEILLQQLSFYDIEISEQIYTTHQVFTGGFITNNRKIKYLKQY